MTNLFFDYFSDYEDNNEEGKMARFNTEKDHIPVNIFIDNAFKFNDIKKCLCTVDICGVGRDIDVYESEEEYHSAKTNMAEISMIPMGTFSVNDDKDFKESPHIIFSGKVLDYEWNPEPEPDEPNICILIETLGLVFNLYASYDGKMDKGSIVHGVAWLYGDIVKAEDEKDGNNTDIKVDVNCRKKDYTYKVSLNNLPASEKQLTSSFSFINLVKGRKDVSVVIEINDIKEKDNVPQKILLADSKDGLYMELEYQMEDFGWDHPLHLANDHITEEEAATVLNSILVECTDDIPIITNGFCNISDWLYADDNT
jgi:hypothetical protein